MSISGRPRIDSMHWQTRCILRACDVSPSAPLELHEDAWHRLLRIDRLKCLKETGESDYYAILFAASRELQNFNVEFNIEVFNRLQREIFSKKKRKKEKEATVF